jgi:transcriptional pleiotropic regulator of transition state genes
MATVKKETKGEISMKSTGVTRQIDELGRFVLPVEIRRALNINLKDYLEIYAENDRIILKKYQPTCLFCGSEEDNILYEGKRICRACLDKLKNI